MKITSFAIEDDLREQADKWCREHDRSFSYLIRMVLRQFFESNN